MYDIYEIDHKSEIEVYISDSTMGNLIDLMVLNNYLVKYKIKEYVLLKDIYKKDYLKIVFAKKKRNKIISSNFYHLIRYMVNKFCNKLIYNRAQKNDSLIDYIMYIGIYNFEKVKYISSSDMPILTLFANRYRITEKDLNELRSNELDTNIPITYLFELLGFFGVVTPDIRKKDSSLKKDDKIIGICLDNISIFLSKLSKYDEKGLRKYFNIKKQPLDDDELSKVFELFDEDKFSQYVFLHELGHAVFDCVNSLSKEKCERQANYFLSVVTDGMYDKYIRIYYDKVAKLCPIYKEPLLITDSYSKTRKEYMEEVNELYRLD